MFLFVDMPKDITKILFSFNHRYNTIYNAIYKYRSYTGVVHRPNKKEE